MGGALSGCQKCLTHMHTTNGVTHYHGIDEIDVINAIGEQASELAAKEAFNVIENSADGNSIDKTEEFMNEEDF